MMYGDWNPSSGAPTPPHLGTAPTGETTMQVPSGRTLNSDDLEFVRYLQRYRSIRPSEQPFRLQSGIDSHVYVELGREDVTDNPGFEQFVGWRIHCAVANLMEETPEDPRWWGLIGIPTAGTVLAQAAVMAARLDGYPESVDRRQRVIFHRMMRESLKRHGANPTWVNGQPDESRHRYVLLDNTNTDGETKIETAAKLEHDGYRVRKMPCLIVIDRGQGGVQRLERSNVFERVVVMYNLLDIVHAYAELGLWTKEATRIVTKEIHETQFA